MHTVHMTDERAARAAVKYMINSGLTPAEKARYREMLQQEGRMVTVDSEDEALTRRAVMFLISFDAGYSACAAL